MRGTLNDAQLDEGYTVEIAIPWSAFAKGEPKHEKPPVNGSWRMNFFVLDARNEHDQRAVGWSPPRVGDFHVPRRFGNVIFDGPREDAVADSKTATKAADAKTKKAAAPKAEKKTE